MVLFTAGLLVLVLSTALGANSTIKALCPQKATKFIDTKYFGIFKNTCYLFMTYDKVLYETAKGNCQKDGGTLAMPKTKDVNDFLLQEMKRVRAKTAMWIGMNDKAKEGTYVWEDGTEVKSWGNMNHLNGYLFFAGEDCMALNPEDEDWHDYKCSVTGFQAAIWPLKNDKLPFICQFPIVDAREGKDSFGQVVEPFKKKGQGDKGKDSQGQGDKSNNAHGKGDKDNDTHGKGEKDNNAHGKGDKDNDTHGKGEKDNDAHGKGDKDNDTHGKGEKDNDAHGRGDKDNDAHGQGDKGNDTQGQGDKGDDTQGQGDKGNDTQGQGDKGDDTQGQGDKGDDTLGQGDKDNDNQGQGDKDHDTHGQGDKGNDTQGQGDKGDDTQGQGDKGDDTQGQGDKGDDTQGQGDKDKDTHGQGDKVQVNDGCPSFNCPNLDCGMEGFKMSSGCQICECN